MHLGAKHPALGFRNGAASQQVPVQHLGLVGELECHPAPGLLQEICAVLAWATMRLLTRATYLARCAEIVLR